MITAQRCLSSLNAQGIRSVDESDISDSFINNHN